MKTILYNPIFINPQAYYVFPRLTRWLRPDNGYKEPANYIGQIEVTIIAYGEIGYTEYFEHTNYIDFTNFSNSYVRISLFTRLGSCVLGEWKIGAMESDRPYIEPEVLASLKAVVIVGDKTNQDKDRDTVANLVDASNPFIISNTAFKLNSGFGKYSADFESFDWAVNISQKQHNKATISLNGRLCNHTAIEVDEMKVNIIGNVTELIYWYIANPDDTTRSEIRLTSGINTLPKSYAKDDGQTYNIGFAYISGDSEITIEQIPSFEGAFVTDGINDLITSTKTVQEMGITDKVTVVSMIHQIDLNSTYTIATTNYIENSNSREHVRSDVYNYGKTGIYGYSASLINNTKSDIKNILGDEADYYVKSTNSLQTIFDAKFSVVGRISELTEASQVAWYWTIIANKVLTTDQINQVIDYFNLDRTLNPDILCNTIKQGITNENHAEFGDKLIDFSGNGRDIQLNNIAWDGDSGIGKYNYPNWKVTATIANTYSTIVNYPTVNGTYSINVNGVSELMQSIGLHLEIKYTTSTGIIYNDIKQDGVYSYILPDGATDLTLRFGGIPGIVNEPCNITITQIPSHAGALCLDGVNDFGQFVGDLELKDYTFIADRAYSRIAPSQVPFIASTQTNGQAPFLMEYLNEDTYVYPHSFGTTTKTINLNIQRQISYQSTYVYNGNSISKGISVDTGDGLTIGNSGSTGAQYSPLCLWSLMLFPYSMSEFLIERQLKKHKLGTLYPDMVEFRPVIKANANYKITYYQIDSTNTWKSIKVGDYIVIGAKLAFQITFDNDASELKEVVSPQLSGIIVEKRPSNPGYNIYSYITSKSPQKINITIDEYIRFEDIVQPYPVLLRFNDENGNEVSWGGKFKVGSTITRIGSIADPESNLLNGLYSISGLSLNGKTVTSSTSIVEKQMVFRTTATWLLDNNEPKCILSPRLLRIPNSSYKILGYIPDISGHGNNGVIHNSAYAEGSGVNEDGSYQFDGVDDFVTIPTTVGGKQVLMKVNWDSPNASILYDQRGYTNEFAIYNGTNDSDGNPIPAYQGRNNGQTYIDGILNSNIKASELRAITHNITITNELSAGVNKFSPVIGSNRLHNAYFVNMALYDFMLFDEISTDDKILELNEYVGIEGNTDDLFNETN